MTSKRTPKKPWKLMHFMTVLSKDWEVWGRYATKEQAERAIAAQWNKTNSMRWALPNYAKDEAWKIEYDGKE